MTEWLNVKEVQKALHVSVAHRKNGQWAPSSGLNYTHTAPTLLHMYPRLIEKIRILLFSGDVDECVPYNGAEQWTRGFGYEEAEHWHPWTVDGQVGGYATIYDTPHNFTWATVRGAGHMAPLYQPLRVFHLFSEFLHGEAP
jgi:serine carboxypeptidase-like clade 1